MYKFYKKHTAIPPRPPLKIPTPTSIKLVWSDEADFNLECMR